MAYVPKHQVEVPETYTRQYTHADGSVSIWYFDRKITKSGPYRVEHKYSKEFLEDLKKPKKRVAKKK